MRYHQATPESTDRFMLWVRTLGCALWFLPLVHGCLPAILRRLSQHDPPWMPDPLRKLGYMLILLGGSLTLWSVQTLVRAGDGTPAPYDPPKKLVSDGPYSFCRNPMELGNILMLIGRGLATGHAHVLRAGLAFAAGVHAWIVLIEEPRLRRLFGSRYEAYRRQVPRWGWSFPGVPPNHRTR